MRTIALVATAEEKQALCSLIQRADHCMVVAVGGECHGFGRARRQADERTAKGAYFAETPTNSSSVSLSAGLTHTARRLLQFIRCEETAGDVHPISHLDIGSGSSNAAARFPGLR